jgi:hypothetical protein
LLLILKRSVCFCKHQHLLCYPREYNIHHAQYDKIKAFATTWTRDNNAYNLDFAQQENHYIRGELLDALEDKFAFLTNNTIPRVWRDSAIRSIVAIVRTDSTNRPTLVDPSSPRKRKRYQDYRSDKPNKSKVPSKARAYPLKDWILVFENHGANTPVFTIELRSLVGKDDDVLLPDYTLNTRYVGLRYSSWALFTHVAQPFVYGEAVKYLRDIC